VTSEIWVNKENDPKRERNGMDVHERVREWSSKQAGEKVRAVKADQDNDQRDSRHCGEEEVVVAGMQASARSGSGHESSWGSLGRGVLCSRDAGIVDMRETPGQLILDFVVTRTIDARAKETSCDW
jgi:hypothetical protein